MPQLSSTEQFRLFTVFCSVAENLSFSRAAKQIGISQPAVSVNIAALEAALGNLLFERRRPNLLLTPDGESLYQLAKPLVTAVENVPGAFADSKGEVNHGTVRVMAGETVLLHFMPEIAKAFQQQYPRILLQLGSIIAKDIPQALLNNEADFALGSLLEDDDRLRMTPIYHFSPLLLLAANHPLVHVETVTLEDVAKYPLIVPPKNSYSWKMTSLVFAQHKLDYHIALEASSSEVVKRMVAAGVGVALLSEAITKDYANIVTRPFDRYLPTRSYAIIERRGKFPTPQAEQLKKQVLQWAKRHQ